MFTFRYHQLRRISAFYVALPLLVFCIGFLRPIFAIIGVLVVAGSFLCVIKTDNTETKRQGSISFTKKGLVFLFIVMLLWNYLGGMNGFFYQTSDWEIRNAVYRDLCTHHWPVIYEREQAALTYYIGHWLVPAAISKPVYALLGTRVGWIFARQALWLWSTLGTFLVALNVMLYVHTDKIWKKIFCVVTLIGFSGMDIFGAFLKDTIPYVFDPENLHLEWWSRNGYQFSANTVCLYWVFNQAIIPWLVVTCFLMERDPRNYLFWGLACFICGPFPFVELVILMVVKAIVFVVQEIREKSGKDALRTIFSPQNILLLFMVFPAIALFYISNNAASAGVSLVTAGKAGGSQALVDEIRTYLNTFFVVFLMDVGIYLLLLFSRQKHNPIFYVIAILMFTLSFFRIGVGHDFGWRTSLPSFFILMMFFDEEIITDLDGWRALDWTVKGRTVLLTLVFMVGLVTPELEIYRGIYHVKEEKTIRLARDSRYSLDDGQVSSYFETSNFSSNPFFKYLAKRPNTGSCLLFFGDGFSEAEQIEGSNENATFRWVEKDGTLQIYNGFNRDVNATLEMVFGLQDDLSEGPMTLDITVNGELNSYRIIEKGQHIVLPVSLHETETTITLETDSDEILQASETADYYFTISGVRLLDEEDNPLWEE